MANDEYSFKMYSQLLEQELEEQSNKNNSALLNFRRPSSNFVDDDDDGEDFVTSKEIVNQKNGGITRKSGLTSNDDGVVEESVHFKRFRKINKRKYTQEELANIRKSCMNTIVHDYGMYDIYHISDEERNRNDQLAEISVKLARVKTTYRRVDQYIEAMRIVFEAWNILEKVNYVHTRDEFFDMVADGRIYSNRIIMPKLVKMNQYNMDTIIRYISNPELDPSVLVPKREDKYDDFFNDVDESTEEEMMRRLLSEEEAEIVFNKSDEPHPMEIGYIKPKYIKGYDKRLYKKKRKNESKTDKYIRKNLADFLNKIQNGIHYREAGYNYAISNSLFEPTKKEKSFWDKMKFEGSWSKNTDVELYAMMVTEEIMNQPTAKEKYMTYGDKELQKFYKRLEENGVNTIELRRRIDKMGDSTSKRLERLSKKENKRLENAIMQRIAKLNKNPKFKKITKKAEDALNKGMEGE